MGWAKGERGLHEVAPELELEGDEQEFCYMDVPRYLLGLKGRKAWTESDS